MKHVKEYSLGNIEITFTSDVSDGEILDTEVKTHDGILCTIAGPDRFNFLNELEAIIQKYRI